MEYGEVQLEQHEIFLQDRAALMRSAAENAETPQLHTARLRAAAGYDALAEKAEREKTPDENRK